jgi:hypothetical protein
MGALRLLHAAAYWRGGDARGGWVRVLREPVRLWLEVVASDWIPEDDAVGGDVELADFGVVGACA